MLAGFVIGVVVGAVIIFGMVWWAGQNPPMPR